MHIIYKCTLNDVKILKMAIRARTKLKQLETRWYCTVNSDYITTIVIELLIWPLNTIYSHNYAANENIT